MTKTIITFGLNTFTMKGDTTMNDLTPLDALDIVESCLEHFADDPLVAEAAATIAAALDEREQLRKALEVLLAQLGISMHIDRPRLEQARDVLKRGESNDSNLG